MTSFALPVALLLLLIARNFVFALPPGFIEQSVAHFSSDTTEVSFAPKPGGGFLILAIRKSGQVYVFEEDPKDNTFNQTLALDLKDRSCFQGERGLHSIVAHPDFLSNGWVYLYYTHKEGRCAHSPRNRCSRFTMNEDLTIDESSEVVLFQTILLEEMIHHAGDLEFGSDGHLYVAVGDGGLRRDSISQHLNHLMGSMIRITDTGDIPAGNPFVGNDSARCNETGTIPIGLPETTACQEIYSYGLRNPFRFCMDPNSDEVRFLISDTGENAWEEINEGGQAHVGTNYGFPVVEGPCTVDSKTDCPTNPRFQDPIHWYEHNKHGGGAVTGIAIPPNGAWPPEYDNSFLFIDFVFGSIFHATPRKSCRDCSPPISGFMNTTFHRSRQMVDIKFGPYYSNGELKESALYFTSRSRSERPSIRRIVYAGGDNNAPSADFIPQASIFRVTEESWFDASGSYDIDGDRLTYRWRFGDGAQRTTFAPTIVHTYTEIGTFVVNLLVTDGKGGSQEKELEVRVGRPPAVTIISPREGQNFAVGDIFMLNGTATDTLGNILPNESLNWEVRRHHNVHYHPFLSPTSGNQIELSPAPEPEDLMAATNSYLEVRLTATDTDGLQTTVSHNLPPKTIFLDFDSVPSGLEIVIDDTKVRTPRRILSWENHDLRVNAINQNSFVFNRWSNGENQFHFLNVPAKGPDAVTSYSATFTDSSVKNNPVCLRKGLNYNKLCGDSASRGCCNSVREETLFCWKMYENIFPGDQINEVCQECCGKEIGQDDRALEHLPKTMKCFDLGRPSQICRTCCLNPRSQDPFCEEQYQKLGGSITEACHYCCRAPLLVGPDESCQKTNVNYEKMCTGTTSCCGTQRSDLKFCWRLYEDVFPGSDIDHACRSCCGKEIGPPNPPHPELPKTLKCSAIRPALTCKHCCQNPRSNIDFCKAVYEEFDEQTLKEACHYCCAEPKTVGDHLLS